jgi:hypothetical protein
MDFVELRGEFFMRAESAQRILNCFVSGFATVDQFLGAIFNV